MIRKVVQTVILGFLSVGTLFSQQNTKTTDTYYRCFAGSSAFLLGNLSSNSPSFYQLNFGYRITSKDVVSLEAITWKFDAPLGIPYGPSYGDESENYPGSIREYGIGVVYQRFLWKGLYTSLQALPLKRVYFDENDKKIQNGFQLFSTFRIGYHIPLYKNRFFIEPSIAGTFWPISTNVPQAFADKDEKWNKYFLFEPGLHFGVNF
ncbi:MAG TPA: hypothetical protein DCQ26_10350 [Marinilabiliales bacterium]|jgi:hypothetical protein|nr:MAG: hypothetical protein A2W95_05335 [Bacteroidetes bacterium GWA2_40_14]OFX59888.1 MAG: hypothetical protein A2W84_02095 [Bacteroidetes bacterium GWC2_40_13]OFX75111.1 MAG: hypothetical protein A2W96_17105 [Bacteroidetes bacterium GWD2_40_43]OFX93840.1 MAG: hypothetical protein A2W97_00280 [Bacteroidetes bacterium GWE2_40_63]OFY18087.1 MAG: hypothetical protein A2W88_01050 [Bacteroidetes bacterium GWF2_40_13]OFZ27301.1 MAG: hypothetical protein A2437_13655 [Bacteroidetes bacterium RIFOXYC